MFIQHQSKQWTLGENDMSMWVPQFNKATTLMGGVDDGGSYAYVEGKRISQNLLINFAMNLKLLQK